MSQGSDLVTEFNSLWDEIEAGRKVNSSMKFLEGFSKSLFDPELRATGLKVALVVGSILFAINHGSALLKREMNRQRWISGVMTYCVPYVVNIHGQYTVRSKQQK